MNDKMITEIWVGNQWKTIDFSTIKKGDTIRMFYPDPDRKPVYGYDNVSTVFVASCDAKVNENGIFEIVCDLSGDRNV